MLRRARFFRAFALSFVVLQLALRTVAGIADARLSAASSPWEHFVHFESKGSTHLPPEHGVDCGLCSYISASFTRSPAVALHVLSVQRVAPAELAGPLGPHADTPLLHPARAPPTV